MVEFEKEEDFFHSRGFGKQLGIGEKPCIIVVDFILGFTDPNMPMGSDSTQQIHKTNQLIDRARRVDIPVFFTTISYDDDSFSDSVYGQIKCKD